MRSLIISTHGEHHFRDLPSGSFTYSVPILRPQFNIFDPINLVTLPDRPSYSRLDYDRAGQLFDGTPVFLQVPGWSGIREYRTSINYIFDPLHQTHYAAKTRIFDHAYTTISHRYSSHQILDERSTLLPHPPKASYTLNLRLLFAYQDRVVLNSLTPLAP